MVPCQVASPYQCECDERKSSGAHARVPPLFQSAGRQLTFFLKKKKKNWQPTFSSSKVEVCSSLKKNKEEVLTNKTDDDEPSPPVGIAAQ
jgi:hypothetical protein